MPTDNEKTKAQLIDELADMRRRVAEMEAGRLAAYQPPAALEEAEELEPHVEFQGREVSCRAVGIFFQQLKVKGLEPEALTEGVNYSLDHLKDKNERIDWASYLALMENVSRIWTDEELVGIGEILIHTRWLRPFAIISRFFFSVNDIYRWTTQPGSGPGNIMFSCLRSSVREAGPQLLELTIRMLSDYAPCREFFYVTLGNLSVMPELLGLEKAEIDMERFENGARFLIQAPEGGGTLARMRKAVSWPFTARAAAKELREAHELLQKRYQELEAEVSERQRAEEQIRVQANLLDNVSDAVISTDMDFNILSWNWAAEKLYGWKADEAIGQPFQQFLNQEYIDDSRDVVIGNLLEKGAYEGEVLQSRKDGTSLNVLGSVTLLRDSEGNPVGVVGVNRDITLRKQAAEALRESEENYRQLVEHSLAGIYIVQEHIVTFCNQQYANIFGYESAEELIGKNTRELIAPESWETVDTEVEARASGLKESSQYGFKGVKKDGTIFDIEVWGTQIEYRGKSAIQGTLVDVTERKRAEDEIRKLNDELEQRVTARTAELKERVGEVELLNRAMANVLEDQQAANRRLEDMTQKLQELNKELEAFSYSVSHDLRAPLRALEGFSSILVEQYGSNFDEEGGHYLQRILGNTRYMGELIDGLLALSRLSRQELNRQVVQPTEIVEQVLEGLGEEGREVKVTLGDLPECRADPTLLRQVFANLLANAYKFTQLKEDAHIEVGVEEIKGEQIYFVKDNGVGFNMAYADKLFEVFQRLHGMEEYEGTGVGLAIVLRIVRRHGGRVWADAEIGRGATFYFTVGVE